MLLAQPPQSLAAEQEYSLRQRPLSGVDFDFSAYSPTSSSITTTQSQLGSPFTPDLDSLFAEDSGAFLSKFQASLPVPFADHFSPTEQQLQEDDILMNRTADFYTPNRTQQTAPRSASSQTSRLSGKDHQQGQWYPQSHLAPQPRRRLQGQLAGHKRNHSGSTITSTGPSSPFTPVVQPYPQIHDPEAAAQHYPSPLSGDFDLTPQAQQIYGKQLPAAQGFAENFFGNGFASQQQQSQQNFRNTHHANGESTLPYQVMVRNAIMSQDSNGSNGSVPTLQRFPTSEFERDFRATVDSRATVPKFDRSLSDIYQDELYNPSVAATMPTSQPQTQQCASAPHRDVFSERLQAANSEHLSARSSTPATTLSRDRSPFRADSQYVNDELPASIAAGSSPASRLNSAAQLRERAKAEADAAAVWFQSQQKRQSYEEPKTISPKDALIDSVDPDVNTFPLFSQQDGGHRFSLPQDPQYSMQHDPHFGGEVPRRSSGPAMTQQRQRHHSQQYQMFPQNFGQQFASQESNPEFPANLTSMESTRSDAHSTPTSSQNSESSTRASSDLPVQRPENTMANAGSYACTFPGCTARFDGPGRLQRHRNVAHNATNAQASPVRAAHVRSRSANSPGGEAPQTSVYGVDDQTGGLTGAALAARNSQAGPHKCERINPSTGQPCNSIFSRPYDLTRHEETIHNARKQKVRCQYCTEEKTFSRADALTRHMRVVHPEMEFNGKRARRV